MIFHDGIRLHRFAEEADRCVLATTEPFCRTSGVLEKIGRGKRIIDSRKCRKGEKGIIARSSVRLLYEIVFAPESNRHHIAARVSHRLSKIVRAVNIVNS